MPGQGTQRDDAAPAPHAAGERHTLVDDLLAASDEVYELTDLSTSKRIGGLACAVGLLILFVLAPFDPPTHHVGEAGWLLAVACAVITAGVAARLLRWPEEVTPNELLLLSYLALAVITALEWLGGHRSPYVELFLLAAVYTAAVHPPRRVLPYLLALALAVSAPLLYDGWDGTLALEIMAHFVLWTGLAVLALLFTATVRRNRQRLRNETETLREVARADPLTRLGNRRAFDEALAKAISGARRWDRPFSILVADLAGFKDINDRFGHLEGDRCLRDVGNTLRTTVRHPDACFRWGGDEFALVLPATDLPGAQQVGQRVGRATAQRVTLPSGEPLRVRWAAAQFEDGMDAQALVAAADVELMATRRTAGTEGPRSQPQGS